MAIAIDTIDGWGLSNKACRELLAKKSKGNAVFAIHFTVNQLYITNKTKRSVLKVGVSCGLRSL